MRDLSLVASTVHLHPTRIAVDADDDPRGFPRREADDANSRTVRMVLSRSALRIESVAEFPEGGAPVRISHRLCPSSSRRPGILADRSGGRGSGGGVCTRTGEKVGEKEGEKREKSIHSTSRTLLPFHNRL